MNHYRVPDWSMDDESQNLHDLLHTSSQKNRPDNELVELIWSNGHVVVQGQSNLKPPPTVPDSGAAPKFGSSVGNSSNLIQEDGPSSWFQYPLDDLLEREFSDFFCEIPVTDTIYANKPNKDVLVEGEKCVKFGATDNSFTMPPPKFGSTVHRAPGLGSRIGGVGIGESSYVRTVGSSACGSNQADISHNLSNVAISVRGRGVKETNAFDPTVTSSSGGSGCSFGRTMGPQSSSDRNHKRKRRDGEDSECYSEEAEYEPIDANRTAHRSGSTRKSRAAEVHNLSERRRRDRINEKMKALQELIPHCNKSDKASMLDEAIEYLKSLQLQLQLMWTGSGMAPMMFPSVQQYMSRLSIGMGHPSMPTMNNPIQLPSASTSSANQMPMNNPIQLPSASTSSANQMPMCPSQVLNPINFPRQMQNVQLPGFPHMQLPPQAMNLYAYGSHMVQQNKTASSSSLPTIPSEKI